MKEKDFNNDDELIDDIVTEHSNYKVPVNDEKAKYHLSGMFKGWFLEYASYVNLERAIPHINDGLKPVQRRVLHSLKELDDGRYNKVANVVGNTMKYHPHGDASIGDALVNIGQKNYLVDCQGNWGNILTGQGAAAPRYIEARLSKLALETLFNHKTTEYKSSYDGRNKEPLYLPAKFPLLLAQGSEGIGTGLNSRILPHNFNELIDACVAHLSGESFQLLPDFPTGGLIDVSSYNDGERGGKVKIRAKIEKLDQRTLVIKEVPYGVTTSKLIETILNANDKGKINIKKVDDNTAANVEILVHLEAKTSSDKTIDALYAFTSCEVSYSPNCCVVKDNKPIFTNVSTLLRHNAEQTKYLLQQELEIQLNELFEQLFFASLEKIFIEERIYKDKEFENSKSNEEAIVHIDKRLEPYKPSFIREITSEDLYRLLEIRMARILRFRTDEAEDKIAALEKRMEELKYDIEHIVKFTIDWFRAIQKKYGAEFPRMTEIRNFETILASKVVEANEKLYINREEGFIGTGLKKDEFVCNCSDIDDIIIFFRDGKYKIVKVADKMFVGKNIIHIAVFVKNDKRTIYNVVYRDGRSSTHYYKRCAINGVTRDKDYDLTQGKDNSRIVYFSVNPNGEAEVIKIILKPTSKRLKNLTFEKDFGELAIKGRQSMGNLLTKFDVHRVVLKSKGESTLGGAPIYFDHDVLRLNGDKRGEYLGDFIGDEQILVITQNGQYYTTNFDLNNHYDDNILKIEKFDSDKIWSIALYDAEQKYYYIKRFQLESSFKKTSLLGDNDDSKMILLSDQVYPRFKVIMGGGDSFREPMEIDVDEFIAVKGYKAKGKRITTWNVETIEELEPLRFPEVKEEEEMVVAKTHDGEENTSAEGETEVDLDDPYGQMKLF